MNNETATPKNAAPAQDAVTQDANPKNASSHSAPPSNTADTPAEDGREAESEEEAA